MINDVTTPATEASGIDRRQHDRIPGPFDGFRVGALETPLRIFDLSKGGCFVNAMHEQTPGISFQMKIELPYVGAITVKAETLYRRPGFGYAVRFVDMNEETISRLEQALEQLQERAAHDA
jgi:PilZ domain